MQLEKKTNVSIIGTGFVGVVSAAVYASFGNTVIGLDIDPQKIEKLKQGIVPFFEPGLSELLVEQQQAGNLHFTTNYSDAISNADVIILAVGTPSSADGQVDLRFVYSASEYLAQFLKKDAIVVVKSTVPPGTLSKVKTIIEEKATHNKFYLASLPEFLKEGTAVQDTLHPDRVVIGALSALHAPLNAEIVKLSPESAQMAKYASNAYLANRITFINQIADLCEHNGADIQEVIKAMGLDKRIGHHYWYPGMGYGGSCFPKDVKELAAYSRSVGQELNLLNQLNRLNEERIPLLMKKYEAAVGGWSGKKVAVLGLSFKPDTDDMREAPAVKVIPLLAQAGAEVIGYDPKAIPNTKYFIAEFPNVRYTEHLDEALKDVDVVMVLIEWAEIIQYDLTNTRQDKPQWIIDTRNQFDSEKVNSLGYTYIGTGR
jgi:UDPglucose 6-dehydrogenase